MSIETLSSLGGFESKKDIKSELEEIRGMQEKRELLQKHWSDLFEQEQSFDSKYPEHVKWTEDKKFKSDRSFYSPEDLEEFRKINEQMEQVKTERDEMDREIIRRRFEVGLKHLEDLNIKDEAPWRLTRRHDRDPNNHMDLFDVKEYKCLVDDIDARLQVTYELVPDFFEGMGRVAKIIGDTELEEKIEQIPKKRKLPYTELSASFSVGPRKLLKSNTDLWPGVSMQKRLDPYDENLDKVSVSFPTSMSGYSFPQISDSDQERAKEEMIKLIRKLGVENIKSDQEN